MEKSFQLHAIRVTDGGAMPIATLPVSDGNVSRLIATINADRVNRASGGAQDAAYKIDEVTVTLEGPGAPHKETRKTIFSSDSHAADCAAFKPKQ